MCYPPPPPPIKSCFNEYNDVIAGDHRRTGPFPFGGGGTILFCPNLLSLHEVEHVLAVYVLQGIVLSHMGGGGGVEGGECYSPEVIGYRKRRRGRVWRYPPPTVGTIFGFTNTRFLGNRASSCELFSNNFIDLNTINFPFFSSEFARIFFCRIFIFSSTFARIFARILPELLASNLFMGGQGRTQDFFQGGCLKFSLNHSARLEKS